MKIGKNVKEFTTNQDKNLDTFYLPGKNSRRQNFNMKFKKLFIIIFYCEFLIKNFKSITLTFLFTFFLTLVFITYCLKNNFSISYFFFNVYYFPVFSALKAQLSMMSKKIRSSHLKIRKS